MFFGAAAGAAMLLLINGVGFIILELYNALRDD